MKIVNRLLLMMVLLVPVSAIAAAGDTTVIQAHNNVEFNHFGNFDTSVVFPDGTKSYRKIQMTFTLGKYQCPGSPQYCGDWDYTVSIFILTKAGDTVELSRYITPYANAGYARTPWNWKQRYEFDVTDFYNQLKDTATVRVHYSGYSWGFTGDVKFDMIEGTPPRNVIKMDNAWQTSSRFGDTSASAPKIEERVDEITLTAPTGTISADLRLIISGHGSDDNGCSEFCKKFYEVELNQTKFDKTELWRDDCGYNHMYPQSGTWVYDRGNWCPGDVVFPNRHILSGVSSGNSFDLDVDFENYIGSNNNGGSWGSYTVRGCVFYYGAFNKNVDAELENIVAPNNHETFYRYNPVTGHPIIIVRNTGGNTITSIKLKYELAGGSGVKEYEWKGSLASLDTAWVELPVFYDLYRATGSNNKFSAEIVAVNGSADEDATNNKMTTVFTGAKTVPYKFIILTKTNLGVLQNGKSETSWKLIDIYNNKVVLDKNNMSPNTIYEDTVEVTVGMYMLVVEDAGCQGLRWWANPRDSNGYVSIRPVGSLSGIQLDGYFGGDFGCGFTQYLNVGWPANVPTVVGNNPTLSVYPNPASDNIMVSLSGIDNVIGKIEVRDMTGRLVHRQTNNQALTTINTAAWANGVYTITYTDVENNKLLSKVVIAK